MWETFKINNGLTYENIPLSNVVFELIVDEPIIVEGQIIYNKGDIIDTFKTNDEGKITIKDLYFGKYKLKEVSSSMGNIVTDIEYKIDKASAPITAVNVVISIGYFIIFQYMNNGQTLGKKIFKIKVESETKKKVSLLQMTLRSLLINVIAFNLINVLAVVFLPKEWYLSINSIVTFGQWLVFIISSLLILYNKDKNGVHDMLAKTKVVDERR